MTYFGDIKNGIKTTAKGLQLTFRHLLDARRSRKPIFVDKSNYFEQETGIVTLQYPHEAFALPEIGRHKLHNEIDDCIVCDKCAKVCPVDCIDIEAIKSSEIISYASDGSPIRLYAGKFDIDMAKCCFCGLCTTVCPTECLTMTNEYDFSTPQITDLNFVFGNLSPEQAQEKRALYEQFLAEKQAAINEKATISNEAVSLNEAEGQAKPKPVFKPTFKKSISPTVDEQLLEPQKTVSLSEVEGQAKPKPVFKPTFKKSISPTVDEQLLEPQKTVSLSEVEGQAKPKPVFKPTFKKPVSNNNESPKN